MRFLRNLLTLPPALILLIVASSDLSESFELNEPEVQRPPHVKYWPEDPPHRRRDLEDIQRHIDAGHTPITIKKMSGDEGEKFLHEYYGFEDDGLGFASLSKNWIGQNLQPRGDLRSEYGEEVNLLLFNSTATCRLRPPFAFHATGQTVIDSDIDKRKMAADNIAIRRGTDIRAANRARAILEDRQFMCVVGTFACTSIGYPNSCCGNGETCVAITDTGLGPVGCCPSGATCTGGITSCAAGNTACADSLGGGCCIPGYVCSGVGCVLNVIVSVTTTVTLPSTTQVMTSVLTSTLTTNTDTALQTTLACSASYQACPINLGGGCCLSNRVCTTGLQCPLPPGVTETSTTTTTPVSTVSSVVSTTSTSTSTASPVAPLRGTTATESSTSITDGTCPTGFYVCSAYYQGGCCRVGRDCQTTDCPVVASVTVVTNGATIVVPATDAATTTAAGVCATGWTSCAASLGGNCCPTGWACGTESCSSISTGASATATESVAKEGLNAASAGERLTYDRCFLALAIFAASLGAFYIE